MSHVNLKNVKHTKSVLSLAKFDQIPAICSGYLCDFMRFFFFVKSFIIGGVALYRTSKTLCRLVVYSSLVLWASWKITSSLPVINAHIPINAHPHYLKIKPKIMMMCTIWSYTVWLYIYEHCMHEFNNWLTLYLVNIVKLFFGRFLLTQWHFRVRMRHKGCAYISAVHLRLTISVCLHG